MDRWACTGLLLIGVLMAGCSSSLYGWHVRTHSSAPAPSFNQALLSQEPVAIFGALAQPALGGNEIGIDAILAEVVIKVAPHMKVVDPKDTMSRINANALADDYVRLRNDALQSGMLSRDPLRKIGTAIGARYAFQPRLTAFTQLMTDRWKVPGFELRVVQTRSSILRVALQLWDTQTGELLWVSTAEGTLQSEAFAQDPVYFEDAARVTLGSMLADLLNGKTASTYGPLNEFIDQLIQIPQSDHPTNGQPSPSQ